MINLDELIVRTEDIKEAIDAIVSYTKKLASIFMEDKMFDKIVFSKEGEYVVTVLADPDGNFIVETKLLGGDER